jgi:hypothetical protein
MNFGIEGHSPGRMLANVLRNLSLHFSTRSHALTGALESIVRRAIVAIGQQPDDPRAVFLGLQSGTLDRFFVSPFTRGEIWASNSVTLLLGLCAAGALGWNRRRDLLLYFAGLAGAFVLFSATVRWQIWGSRFHLPLFVLAAVPIGLFLQERSARVQGAVIAVLLGWAVYLAACNDTRSLVPSSVMKGTDIYRPRAERYYSDGRLDLARTQILLAEALNRTSCDAVAFDSHHDLRDADITMSPNSFFIYPLMALIGADEGRRRVWYEGVHNMSARYEGNASHPPWCAVVCLSCAGVPTKLATYGGGDTIAQTFGHDVLFTKATSAP